jgi:hypothetical protein
VFVCWEINQKSKLPVKCNKAMGEVGAGNGCAVPHVQREENCFHCNSDGPLLVCHDFQTLILEIAVYTLTIIEL